MVKSYRPKTTASNEPPHPSPTLAEYEEAMVAKRRLRRARSPSALTKVRRYAKKAQSYINRIGVVSDSDANRILWGGK